MFDVETGVMNLCIGLFLKLKRVVGTAEQLLVTWF
jgi:hypothetical protein